MLPKRASTLTLFADDMREYVSLKRYVDVVLPSVVN